MFFCRCRFVLLAFALGACSSSDAADSDTQPTAPAPAPKTVTSPVPAKKSPVPAPAKTPAVPLGSHLDNTESAYQPSIARSSRAPRQTVVVKKVELTLRSTPPGAVASIDGKRIGITPTFWSGAPGHQSHDFTFVKKGYSMARYRFVATQNGIVHSTLTPLVSKQNAQDNEVASP